MAKTTNTKPQKARYWTGLVYPEDLPEKMREKNTAGVEKWVEVLRDSLCPFLISPLHKPDPEKEVDSSGSVILKTKKPHHHILYCHGNTTTQNGAKAAIPDGIIANNHIEAVSSQRNLARYFLHLDQPEKEQFEGVPRDLLTVLNGYPLDLEREMTGEEERQTLVDIFTLMRKNQITEYSELMDSLMAMEDWKLFDYVASHTTPVNAYIASKRHILKWELEHGKKKIGQPSPIVEEEAARTDENAANEESQATETAE